MLGKDLLRVGIYAVGITSVASLVWLAGPLIVIGGYHPLDSYLIREVVILLLVAAFAGLSGWNFWKRKKAADNIAQGIAVGEQAQAPSRV